MSDLTQAIDDALAYLEAMEARDFERARGYVADGALDLVFPGDRHFTRIDQIAQNSSARYRFVGKRFERRDAWESDGLVRVMLTGTLYGEWPDGTPFEGIRFIDWFEFEAGRIRRQHVWNDTAERLLEMPREAAR